LGGRFVKEAQALGKGNLPAKGQSSGASAILESVKTLWAGEEAQPAQRELKVEPKTGLELLDVLGLRGKIVYIVYGRPSKQGEETWGSLGASRTAEESWQVFRARQEAISQAVGRKDFALNVLNPVYRSRNGVIKDIYIRKALELAPENRGLVALNFNSLSDAKQTLQRLEKVFPRELLAYLAVGLDIEHFPGGQAEASSLNEFCSWFARKHHEWAGDSLIPGLVLIYTFRGSEEEGKGRILNLENLVQYYLPEKTLVVALFDGYGTKESKLRKMASLVSSLPNTLEFPALVGVMEFRSRWGDKYDKSPIRETFTTLRGAPTFFFASQ